MMNKMKILFLRDQRTPPIDGAGLYLLRVCRVLNVKKIPYLLLYGGTKDIYYKQLKKSNINVKLINFPKETPKNFFRFFRIFRLRDKIKKLIIKEKFTIINTHFPHLNFFLSKSINIPLISYWHGADVINKPIKAFDISLLINFRIRDLLFQIYRKFNVFNFNLAKFVVVPGKASRITAIKKFNVDKNKIIINTYGVDTYNSKNIKTIHKEFNLSKDTKIILSAGRIVKDKGVEEFCELAKKIGSDKIKFIYLGSYRDYKYYQNLLKKYSKYVIFPGTRMDIERFYKSSYLFLLLSHRESAGLVMAEAMNFGLPLIGWNIIGVNEIIKNGYNGELIKFRDINKLNSKVKELLYDKKKYLTMSKNSFASFKYYKIENSTNRLLKIFNKIDN